VIFDGHSVGSGIVDARASRLVPLPKYAYTFQSNRTAAKPYSLYFTERRWLQYPLILQIRRPYSDLTTFTRLLTETTSCDIELAEAALAVRLLSRKYVRENVPNGDQLLAEALRDYQENAAMFTRDEPEPEPFVFMGLRG